MVILLPFAAGHFLFTGFVYKMHEHTPLSSRVIVTVVLVQVVPYFMTGFAAFAFLRICLHKMGMDNSKALGKEFEHLDPELLPEETDSELELEGKEI